MGWVERGSVGMILGGSLANKLFYSQRRGCNAIEISNRIRGVFSSCEYHKDRGSRKCVASGEFTQLTPKDAVCKPFIASFADFAGTRVRFVTELEPRRRQRDNPQ